MKAWTYTTRGPPSHVLKLRHDLPQPQPTDLHPHEVLIKISHVSLLAPEHHFISAFPHPPWPFNNTPWLPGFCFSGTVVARGSHIHDLDADTGVDVFGMTDPMSYPKTNGALAEYIVVRRDWVATVPRGVSMEEASTLGPPGVTCFAYAEKAGLIEVANDGDGDGSGPRMVNKGLGKRVLITGGSTATGLFMLQLARVIVGEEGVVVTTCSPKHNDAVKALGADETIDYTTTPNLHAHLTKHYSSTPFDFIMDITGTDRHLYPKSPAYLHQNGTFAFAGAMSATHADVPAGLFGFLVFLAGFLGHLAGWGFNMVWPVVLGGVPRKCFFHSGFPNGRDMELTRQLVAEGKVRGSVDSVWRMDDGVKAFEYLATGKVRGKVVVSVRE